MTFRSFHVGWAGRSPPPWPAKSWLFLLNKHGSMIFAIIEILFITMNFLFIAGIAQKWFFFQIPQEPKIAILENPPLQTGKIGRMNTLFVGIDSVEGTHRTDTLMLLGFDARKKKLNLLSIPRDTRVLINGTSRKINEILPRYGENILRWMIEDLMEIKVDRIVKVDFQGFINLIDQIGGIDILIDHPMHYDDNWGNVHIHFDPGQVRLDGKKALEYVRFRGDSNADLGRIKRQQRFISALMEKVKSLNTLVQLPQLLKEGMANIQTDFSLPEALEIISTIREEKFVMETMSLGGEAKYIDKISYFIPYKDQAVLMGAKFYSSLQVLELDASFTPNLKTDSKP